MVPEGLSLAHLILILDIAAQGKQYLQPCVAKIMAATPLSLGEITPVWVIITRLMLQ